ncbi:lipoprotein releasing system, ATP-binding protein [Chromatiales bacterium (ex Bugula neritina AB1)]|nr:lipoprotein releasing system, ATP-binding protein [Chromatiales bacterium (ex Bugula neritina AB1)]
MSKHFPVLHAKGIEKVYKQGNERVEVLNNLDILVEQGEQVAIIGSSGCGKSTLLHVLAGLDKPDRGEIALDGHNIYKLGAAARGRLRNELLGFVYQFHHLLPEFTAVENVAMPLLIGRVSAVRARRAATELLKKVGLGDRLKHKPAEMSGGERQRAAIARALINQPKLVLADEPTGNLDETTAAKVYNLMLELNRELGTAFLIVTHDSRMASRMEKIYRITAGELRREQ